MPSITITVTNVQVGRIREALRDPITGELPDGAGVVGWVKHQLKAAVLRNELAKLRDEAEATKRAELQAEGW